jgi:hypothetical protein
MWNLTLGNGILYNESKHNILAYQGKANNTDTFKLLLRSFFMHPHKYWWAFVVLAQI